jgi:transcriptional regulator with XRE-family HTH domain
MADKKVKKDSVRFRKMLGKKIKFFRKRLGLNQTELMEHLGYTSTGIISQIENGNRGMDPGMLIKAAKLFNVDVAILVSDHDFEDEQLSMILGMFAILGKDDKEDPKYKRLKALLT